MTPVKPQDPNSRSSASAEDLDQPTLSQDAADAELARIDAWTRESFAYGGRQQSQRDSSFGYKETKQR